jgi:uncharacterized membrane protein YhaH (DUF805 family)
MFNYFKECMTVKYADFNGRSRRSEFWYFSLICTIITYAVQFGSLFIFGVEGSTSASLLSMAILIGLIIPRISVLIRRMHDIGKSGWYGFIPLYNIYLCCLDSEPGENEYGPNPKGIGNGASNDELINSIGNN